MTTDSFSGKSEGKEHLTNAVMGLIFLIGGYLIFLQINPNILNINFSSASGMVKVDASELDIFIKNDPDDGSNCDAIDTALKKKGLKENNCTNIFKDGVGSVETIKKSCESRASE
jgi:hypothetical protein